MRRESGCRVLLHCHNSQCCIQWWGKKEEQHFFIRIFMSFYFFERSWSFCGLRDRRTRGDKTNYYIDPQFLLLTIACCVIFKIFLALLLLLGQGCSTGGLLWATDPSRRTLRDSKLALTWPLLTPTLSTGGHPTGGHLTGGNSSQRALSLIVTGSHSGLHCFQLT